MVENKKRNVRFETEDNLEQVYPTLARGDYTDPEFRRCWYLPKEYQSIRMAVETVVQLMNANFPESDNDGSSLGNAKAFTASDLCYRGLEFRRKAVARERKQNKQQAAEALFDEVKLQWYEGVCDLDRFATVYSKFTAHCQEAAQIIGQQDATRARQCYETELKNKFWRNNESDPTSQSAIVDIDKALSISSPKFLRRLRKKVKAQTS